MVVYEPNGLVVGRISLRCAVAVRCQYSPPTVLPVPPFSRPWPRMGRFVSGYVPDCCQEASANRHMAVKWSTQKTDKTIYGPCR